jgi:hypothetical protein
VTDKRLTLREAAAALGVSESAIRKRVERGTLRSDKGPDGRRYVYLETGADTVADDGADVSATHERDELISELHRTNELLREVIVTRDEEIRRRDTIIMNMTEAMKALNPPASETEESSEERESPETVEAEQELATERARHQMAESTMREGMDEERWRREEAERERDNLRRELFALRRRQRESPETVEEVSEGNEPRSYAPGAQEGVQRPWWRKLIRRG